MTDPTAPPDMIVSDTPPLAWLFEEYRRAGGLSECSAARERNDRIRYNRWSGRSADYKKHRENLGEDPIPWEDAWDGRLYTADDILEFIGCVLKNAFRRANFDMKAATAESIPKAANAKKVMTKYRDRDARGLRCEATFIWQFGLGYGASVWQVLWDRQVAMKMESVTLEELITAAQAATKALENLARLEQANPDNPPPGIDDLRQQLTELASIPTRILDPEQEDKLVDLFQDTAQQLAAQLFQSQTDSYGEQWLANYELSRKDARKVVRDLRANGEASYPAPYLHRNAPTVVAREVGIDYWCPPETMDLENAAWHCVRDYLTPAQINENKITDGWDAIACAAAIKTAGTSSAWNISKASDVAIDDETLTYDHIWQDTRSGLVEILYHYARYVTPQGIPQLWCTVYCPHAIKDANGKDQYLRHYPLHDSSSYGFFPYRWQTKRRNFHANIGLPERVGADQASMKRSIDMLVDRQDLEINPPWMVSNRLGMRYKAGPGSQIQRKRPGDVEAMPSPTGNPELAFKLIESAELRLAQRFGLMHPQVPAAHWQTVMQGFTSDYLESAEDMFKHYWRLIQANADATELARISGNDPDFPTDPAEIEGEYEVSMVFSVQDLDIEFVFKKLEAIGQLAVPLDRAGVIDLATLVRLIVMAIDPTLAAAVIKDEKGAAKAIFAEVNQQVLMMSAGNEADTVENDPTATSKLGFLNNIISSNPKYQAMLGLKPMPGVAADPRFAELLTKYQENLQMSVKQERNKQIGRTGVEANQAGPDEAMDMGGAAEGMDMAEAQ